MIVYFLKIFEKEKYMNNFLDGNIYMNRLSYFLNIENDSPNNRADDCEALSGWWQPDQIELTLNERKTTDLVAPIKLRKLHNEHLHAFCLFAGTTDKQNLSDPTKISQIKKRSIYFK